MTMAACRFLEGSGMMSGCHSGSTLGTARGLTLFAASASMGGPFSSPSGSIIHRECKYLPCRLFTGREKANLMSERGRD